MGVQAAAGGLFEQQRHERRDQSVTRRNRASDSGFGREEERQHAETLQDAREGFVTLVRALPEEVRALALGGSEPPARAPRKSPSFRRPAPESLMWTKH